jgi:hypothetical protein
MTEPNKVYAAFVEALVALCKSGEHDVDAMDKEAAPFLARLAADGHIHADFRHIEWQGAWEFGHITIFWCDDEAHMQDINRPHHAMNVYPDGRIEVCS